MLRRSVEHLAASNFIGTFLVIGLMAGACAYGAVRGGAYAQFVAYNGTIPDVLARFCGLPVRSVTISGAHELNQNEVLKLAGIGAHRSLLFLDVAAVRKHLTDVPLIKEASVSKLYPSRLLIEIEERQPYALWQKNGAVSIVAADGTPIDEMHDKRFERLPLVVGEGANTHLDDYMTILQAAGEFRTRIRAGIFVSQRRWSLKTYNGIDIDLPETGAADAIARLAQLEHDGHILQKDILSLDLRIPGRVVARLTEDATAARAAMLATKKKKGAAT